LGQAKVCQIKAALEIGRRLQTEEQLQTSPVFKSSRDAALLLMPQMRDLPKEQMRVLFLDASRQLIQTKIVEQGTVNFAQPILREIFHQAIECSAASLVLVHNHPSGEIKPSQEDKLFTQKALKASEILQIRILDHIIIGRDRYFSFRDHKMM